MGVAVTHLKVSAIADSPAAAAAGEVLPSDWNAEHVITDGVLIIRGLIDATGSPNYPAADKGDVYKIIDPGKIGGASGPNVFADDTLYCTTDSSPAGTEAAVGGNWTIIPVLTIINTDGLNKSVYIGSVAPSSPSNGDVWIDPSDSGDGVTDDVIIAALGYTPADAADIPTAPTQSNQTSSRAVNTTYTNSGARPIMVNATVRCVATLLGGSSSAQGKSDGSTPPTTAASGAVGIQAGLAGEDNTFMLSFVVAPAAKYRIDTATTNGTATLGSWFEVTL